MPCQPSSSVAAAAWSRRCASTADRACSQLCERLCAGRPPILAGLHKLESRVKSLPNGVPIVQGFVEETMAARAGTGAQAAPGKAQTA